MAKNEKIISTKAPKGKNAAQLLKKQANEAAAALRLAALQAKQKLANQARAMGFAGSDEVVIAKANELAKAKAIENNRRKYVEDSLDGPSGGLLKDHLSRLNGPITFEKVRSFFKVYDLPRVGGEVKEAA